MQNTARTSDHVDDGDVQTDRAPRLRVLALVTDAFGGYGGIAQYNRDLVSALAASTVAHVEIDVLARLAPGAPGPLPEWVRQDEPLGRRSRYACAAVSAALRQRPDIVFCGHLYHGPLAAQIATWTGAQLVTQLHGTEIWGDLSRRRRLPLERSDLVLTVSRDTRARVLNAADIEPEKVIVINNTVGAAFSVGDSAAARRRLGLTDEFMILTVARLDTREGYKGHDRIVPLLRSLGEAGTAVCYFIAGVGDDRPRLEALAVQHGVASRVRFLGKVPHDDLPDLYRAADLFALPSTGEGFGIAFLEAMACGTPAIGLAVGGAPDALGDGELGVCVTEADFGGALAEAIAAVRSGLRAPSEAVQARFGFPTFQSRVDNALRLLCAAKPVIRVTLA